MGEVEGRSFRFPVNASPEVGLQDSHKVLGDGLALMRRLGRCFGFIRPLMILSRQRINWSPFMILGESWRLLTHIGVEREIRELLKLSPFDEIIQDNPGLALKFVIPNYLARCLTIDERASCFLHHYRRIHAGLSDCVLRQILQGNVIFHEIAKDGNCFALTIGLPRPPFDKEGEVSLRLRVDGNEVLDLSFIIAPGWVVKSKATDILLITRLQGTSGCHRQAKLVRKRLHEYSPRKLLLAALEGTANAFGIGEMEAVCAAYQRSYGRTSTAILESGYDDFFAKAGMIKTSAGFYSRPIPFEAKPLALFKGRNRSRARKSRAVRQQIKSACTAFLLGTTDRAVNLSFGAVCSVQAPGAAEPLPISISCPEADCNLNP